MILPKKDLILSKTLKPYSSQHHRIIFVQYMERIKAREGYSHWACPSTIVSKLTYRGQSLVPFKCFWRKQWRFCVKTLLPCHVFDNPFLELSTAFNRSGHTRHMIIIRTERKASICSFQNRVILYPVVVWNHLQFATYFSIQKKSRKDLLKINLIYSSCNNYNKKMSLLEI